MVLFLGNLFVVTYHNNPEQSIDACFFLIECMCAYLCVCWITDKTSSGPVLFLVESQKMVGYKKNKQITLADHNADWYCLEDWK